LKLEKIEKNINNKMSVEDPNNYNKAVGTPISISSGVPGASPIKSLGGV